MLSTIKRLTLRMPTDLHAALRALAIREGRSTHAQALYLLRRALETHQS